MRACLIVLAAAALSGCSTWQGDGELSYALAIPELPKTSELSYAAEVPQVAKGELSDALTTSQAPQVAKKSEGSAPQAPQTAELSGVRPTPQPPPGLKPSSDPPQSSPQAGVSDPLPPLPVPQGTEQDNQVALQSPANADPSLPSNFFAERTFPRAYVTLTGYAPGTIVVKTKERHLYYILNDGHALRYPVGVGKAGMKWAGDSYINSKRIKPPWSPPQMMKVENPLLPDVFPSGSPSNPKLH